MLLIFKSHLFTLLCDEETLKKNLKQNLCGGGEEGVEQRITAFSPDSFFLFFFFFFPLSTPACHVSQFPRAYSFPERTYEGMGTMLILFLNW